jgi:hypothetical protein
MDGPLVAFSRYDVTLKIEKTLNWGRTTVKLMVAFEQKIFRKSKATGSQRSRHGAAAG